MKKILISGIVAGIVMFIVSMIFSMLSGAILPSLTVEYENSALFRPWSDPLMSLFFLYPFLLGLVLAWAWDKTKGLVPGRAFWEKGALFGAAFILISIIPGMFMSYSSFQVSFAMVLSWTISSLLQVVCAGMVFAKMNE
ncbi:hypothetical protein KKF81_01320 [Candidatus Micrarchaeota archaeon]|nr:hypothetical protein [Candidatus Micrarchaeota archaeon]MBU1165560.1 hypothetical protein [Candidatus Micrarchaeota archaeon]MBU1887370.1 hypothetical protein [Candidatus Micrarchaeota archaeon]